eukprot:4379127-Alexandrium_andersonii.AAC.1
MACDALRVSRVGARGRRCGTSASGMLCAACQGSCHRLCGADSATTAWPPRPPLEENCRRRGPA